MILGNVHVIEICFSVKCAEISSTGSNGFWTQVSLLLLFNPPSNVFCVELPAQREKATATKPISWLIKEIVVTLNNIPYLPVHHPQEITRYPQVWLQKLPYRPAYCPCMTKLSSLNVWGKNLADRQRPSLYFVVLEHELWRGYTE